MSASARRGRRSSVAALGAALVGLLAGCGSGDGDGTAAGPRVVVSTSVLGDVVRRVAGPEVEVEVLIGAGTDPHEFAPSARQVAELREADLVVVNGGGLEAGLDDVVSAAAGDGTPVLRAIDAVDPVPLPGTDRPDPHFALDPLRMVGVVEALRDRLGTLDGVDDAGVTARAERYGDALRALDRRLSDVLAAVAPARRVLVTNHDALGYLARRYGFEVLGSVVHGGSTLAEPAAADLADLAAAVRARRVPAVFVDAGSAHRLADALAAEAGTGVRVVELYSESLGPAGSGAHNYVAMLTLDARRIAEALS